MVAIALVILAGGLLLLFVSRRAFRNLVDGRDGADPSPSITPYGSADAPAEAAAAVRPSSGATAATVACQFCGAENDPEYTFCRQCTSELVPSPY